ncbi:hypothetical protein [Streptomyces sp. NPDC020983]|uniref:hypothetical protein n=1 Tax=Streptomyces sp. NPDC020983 TaxID=3365106 RepID=UPI0037B222FA
MAATYEEALAAAKKAGTARADDAPLMASFCAGPLQTLVGAVAPKLVWEGAQRKGMTTAELAALCNADPAAVSELMWEEA